MIATRAIHGPVATVRRPGFRALFWDDRQGVTLKLALLALCVIAAGLLEIRW